MANIAQIVNVLQAVILTNGPDMVKTPTYHVFKMYNVHQDATLIPLALECENYTYEGERIPALTASASEKNGVVSITLTNANPNNAVELEIGLDEDIKLFNAAVITGEAINDFNDFGQEEKVGIREFNAGTVKNGKLKTSIPSKSVVLLQLK